MHRFPSCPLCPFSDWEPRNRSRAEKDGRGWEPLSHLSVPCQCNCGDWSPAPAWAFPEGTLQLKYSKRTWCYTEDRMEKAVSSLGARQNPQHQAALWQNLLHLRAHSPGTSESRALAWLHWRVFPTSFSSANTQGSFYKEPYLSDPLNLFSLVMWLCTLWTNF